MENRIDLKIENHIAHAHLIRGDKMNALDAEMMDALIECGERIKADKSIRVVVLSGEGRAFCASRCSGVEIITRRCVLFTRRGWVFGRVRVRGERSK